jgi:hypothetical protein
VGYEAALFYDLLGVSFFCDALVKYCHEYESGV